MFTKPLLWSASKVKHINKKVFPPFKVILLVLFFPHRGIQLKEKKKKEKKAKEVTRGFDARIAGIIQVG